VSHSTNDSEGVPHDHPPAAFPVKALVIAGAVAAVALGVAIVPRLAKSREAVEFAERTAVPTVAIVSVAAGDGVSELVLPASVRAFTDAPVFARTDGYLKVRHADLGARVKAGDILAEIDAPEIDAQLARARAALEEARANSRLAATTAARIETLRDSNAVSAQEIEDKRGDAVSKAAAVAAAEAEVARLTQLVAFRKITAPFDGVITERNTDIGDLIASGNAAARPLFRIANVDTLRVFVNVPEAYAGDIARDTEVTVAFTATPGVSPVGKVVRTAGAIDPASRTMLTEIRLTNSEGKLIPGGYAQVKLKVKAANPIPVVPINVLLFRPEGVQVGVVGPDDTVTLKPVKIGRNFGAKVELIEGVAASDRLILNPSDSIVSGTKVKIFTTPPKEEPAAKPATK
jgi:RND family efflux transporter MFP subunit